MSETVSKRNRTKLEQWNKANAVQGTDTTLCSPSLLTLATRDATAQTDVREVAGCVSVTLHHYV